MNRTRYERKRIFGQHLLPVNIQQSDSFNNLSRCYAALTAVYIEHTRYAEDKDRFTRVSEVKPRYRLLMESDQQIPVAIQ